MAKTSELTGLPRIPKGYKWVVRRFVSGRSYPYGYDHARGRSTTMTHEVALQRGLITVASAGVRIVLNTEGYTKGGRYRSWINVDYDVTPASIRWAAQEVLQKHRVETMADRRRTIREKQEKRYLDSLKKYEGVYPPKTLGSVR